MKPIQKTANHNKKKSLLTGVFLRYKGADDIAKVSAALPEPTPYWGRIHEVKASLENISNLIPQALREGAESWLILYRSDMPQELLILPFPDPISGYHGREYYNQMGKKSDPGFPLFELIRGRSEWSAVRGYNNLKGDEEPWWPRPIPTRFQLLRINVPIDSLLDLHNSHQRDEGHRDIVYKFREVSQRIKIKREEMITSVLIAENNSRKDKLFLNFDNYIAEENIILFEYIQNKVKNKVTTPAIINRFEDIIDNETKIFLISAKTVEQFAREHLNDEFDFSLPGSGLWKAIERELNLSIVWYLRRCHGVVDKDPWVSIKNPSVGIMIKTRGRPVNLNDQEKGKNHLLKGIMLGNFRYMLLSSDINGICDEFGKFLDTSWLKFVAGKTEDSLPLIIKQIAEFRNKSAHISSMTQIQFEQLDDLILSPYKTPYESNLGKILQIKQNIYSYFSEMKDSEK